MQCFISFQMNYTVASMHTVIEQLNSVHLAGTISALHFKKSWTDKLQLYHSLEAEVPVSLTPIFFICPTRCYCREYGAGTLTVENLFKHRGSKLDSLTVSNAGTALPSDLKHCKCSGLRWLLLDTPWLVSHTIRCKLTGNKTRSWIMRRAKPEQAAYPSSTTQLSERHLSDSILHRPRFWYCRQGWSAHFVL